MMEAVKETAGIHFSTYKDADEEAAPHTPEGDLDVPVGLPNWQPPPGTMARLRRIQLERKAAEEAT